MKQTLKQLVIHCTATPEGRDVTAADIRRMHCSPPPAGRGWRQVGYSYLVTLTGALVQLVENNGDDYVDPAEITNGAAGYNSNSLHIVYAGGVAADGRTPKDTRTPAQRAALANFVKNFAAAHPGVAIVGHRDLPGVAKACPSFDVAGWLKEINVKA